jgi:hypothetical protein
MYRELSTGVKWLESEADRSPPTSDEIKKNLLLYSLLCKAVQMGNSS